MKINIIGAGITGLVAAYFLTKIGHEVKVFESQQEVGGLAGFFSLEGVYLEKYYHHIFTGHHELIGLIKELNLGDELFFQKVKMGFYYESHIYPFSNAKDLLSFTPLKIRDRIRLGLSSLMMMSIKNWQGMERKSALEWLQFYSGSEACRVIWGPLLKMKFGDEYERISAAWLWNRVVDRKKSKGRHGKKETLGYIRDGYKKLFDALIERIKMQGGEIHTNMYVKEVCVKDGEKLSIRIGDEIVESEAVLATVPTPVFLQIVPSLPAEYKNKLTAIKYQGSLCVVLKLKKALSDYYWINVSDPDTPFVGIIEHTNLFPPIHYGSYNLVYLTNYTFSEDLIFSSSNRNIYDSYVVQLKKIFPEFKEDDISEYWVFRDRYSQPVFVKNYSHIMLDVTTPIKNLYLLNTSQIYPQSRCLNSSIVKARNVAMAIIKK